jgi:phage terminase large subunit GpA-like protein
MPSFQSSAESLAALGRAVALSLSLLTPPAELTVSEWADLNARLPPEGASEPGQWSTDRAPYQREMMDCANEPGIESAVYMIAAQCGKTASELNMLWYFVAHAPSPILWVMPTKTLAEDLSKERIATAIRDTPALAPLFGSSKTRQSNATILKKKFPGGFLALAGANAPSTLASRPARILFCDEVDDFPASSGTKGDPITIADARTTNFWNRFKAYSSTPGIKGSSRIEKLLANSDMRVYEVQCPHCGTYQEFVWESLKWPGPNSGGSATKHEPSKCYYVCVQGCEILEVEKPDMIRDAKAGGTARWRKTNPGGGDGKTAGFSLSVLYSPWKTWESLIGDWLKAYKNPQQRKAFINTRLARTYEAFGESVDDTTLMKRRGIYAAEVPAGALVLTCGIDVQADRIEGEVVGWGRDGQSWSIDYFIFRGNPAMAEAWAPVDELLQRTFLHESGARLRIACGFIDSGYHTAQVYKFCRPRQVRRVFASKGMAGPAVPLTRPRAKRAHTSRVELRIVGIDTAKEALYANLKVEEIGPAYCHFPSGYRNEQGAVIERKTYDRDYFGQLTAEKLVSEMDGMTPVRKWVKKQERNEALDCRVLAMAALDDLNIRARDWDAIAGNLQKAAGKPSVGDTRDVSASPPETVPLAPDVPADGIPIITGVRKKGSTLAKPTSWAGDWDRG